MITAIAPNSIFTNMFLKYYIDFSVKPLQKKIKAPELLKQYFDVIYNSFNSLYVFENILFECHYSIENNNKILVAFSGGRDSLATTIKLQKMGYLPILFFVDGINRSYPNERNAVKTLSKKLNLDLIIENIYVTGKCDFIENPVKNQFILSMMVDYGINNRISKFSFGCVLDDNITNVNADYMLSDASELFKLITPFFKKHIDNFKIINPIKNETESIIILNKTNLLILTESCMLPMRYKTKLIENNVKKFDFDFYKLGNRCGSCYKCCQEILTLDLIKTINISYELRLHCWKVLKRKSKEWGSQWEYDWIDLRYKKHVYNIKKVGIIEL